MSEIVIVLGSNTHFAPYYYKYEKMLIERRIPFDLIIWDRERSNETTKANNIIRFTLKDKGNNGNFLKIYKFFAFSRFVQKVIKARKYKKIIFLGLSGCAPTLGVHFYAQFYKNACWLDIRDHQYEWFKPYFKMEEKLIKSTFCTVISSRGFVSFLPKWDYTMVHNVDANMDAIVKNIVRQAEDKIRISFIGHVRYYSENIAFINSLANDDRFLIQYYGPGSDDLQRYCTKYKINNVVFENRRFDFKDTIFFYSKTDMINNIYGNARIETRTALSNKLYYSIYLQMPIIVSPNTYMEKVTSKYGFGISFNSSSNFADELYSFYYSVCLKKRDSLYAEAKKMVEEDECLFLRKFNAFLKEN